MGAGAPALEDTFASPALAVTRDESVVTAITLTASATTATLRRTAELTVKVRFPLVLLLLLLLSLRVMVCQYCNSCSVWRR